MNHFPPYCCGHPGGGARFPLRGDGVALKRGIDGLRAHAAKVLRRAEGCILRYARAVVVKGAVSPCDRVEIAQGEQHVVHREAGHPVDDQPERVFRRLLLRFGEDALQG